ncbi:MAG: hypothetical protein ACJ72Z_13800 [Pyrinomonadaceae bacterium]
MKHPKTPIAILILAFSLFSIAPALAQTEKLGPIKFTSPRGFEKRELKDAVVFSRVDRWAGRFCYITLHAAGSSEGSAKKDFAKEWAETVVKPWGALTTPETETELIKGWMLTSGEGEIYVTGNRAIAYLTVLTGYGKSIGLLGILNDNTCRNSIQSVAEGLDIEKAKT